MTESTESAGNLELIASIVEPHLLHVQLPDTPADINAVSYTDPSGNPAAQPEFVRRRRKSKRPIAAFGFDQEWYEEYWHRRAGCGPTTAATILYYLAMRDPDLRCLFPYPVMDHQTAQSFMKNIWPFVTPGRFGVNEPRMLSDGVNRYAAGCGIQLPVSTLAISARPALRPGIIETRDFILSGLRQDRPLAFLNLSNGWLRNLDGWHWVTVAGALWDENRQRLCLRISDSGQDKQIDFSNWLKSSRLGGALVRFIKTP